MSRFILVSRSSDREELILNVDAIELVKEGRDCRAIFVRGHGYGDDDRQINVNESLSDLVAALEARPV